MIDPALKHLNDLILETAVCQLAVDDFEPVVDEDNDAALDHLRSELDVVKMALLNYIIQDGHVLRLRILTDQAERGHPSGPTREGLWKTPFDR